MSSQPDLRARCREAAGIAADAPIDDQSLIGFFQRFRPDGSGLAGLYDGLPRGLAYQQRLADLFLATGDDRRQSGGRDAYFVVRNPVGMSPEVVEQQATAWLESLRRVALRARHTELIQRFETMPRVRVLEGSPPKQLKSDQQSFPLLHAIKVQAATLTDGLATECQVVGLLREAYYFTACDAMLRDYLLWPAYAEHFDEPDPLAAYFELWRHGVKWRVFHQDMVDFYIPRPQPT